MSMIWESGSKSLREIGELFGGLDYAAVAQRIHRYIGWHSLRHTRGSISPGTSVMRWPAPIYGLFPFLSAFALVVCASDAAPRIRACPQRCAKRMES